MVVVGLFHQGMAMSSVSLIRLAEGPGDVLLGIAALLVAMSTVAVVWLSTTRWRKCHVAQRNEHSEIAGHSNRVLRLFLDFSLWKAHWEDGEDDPSAVGFKRMYFLLLDDMRDPWWNAAELASGVVQGAVLGVRLNDITACRAQRIVLVIVCGVMLVGAAACRPFGSLSGNVFLIVSKLGAFLVAVLIVAHTASGKAALSSSAQSTAAAFAFISSVQTFLQLMLAVLLVLPMIWRTLRHQLRMQRDENILVGAALLANVSNANDEEEHISDGGDEMLLLHLPLHHDGAGDADETFANDLAGDEELLGPIDHEDVPDLPRECDGDIADAIDSVGEDEWFERRAQLQSEVLLALHGAGAGGGTI